MSPSHVAFQEDYPIFVSLTVVCLLAIGTFLYSWLFSNFHKRNLPPRLKMSLIQTVSHLLDGSYVPLFYKTSKALGSIFYLVLPLQLSPFIVCCDFELAKILLTGDSSRNLPETDKPIYIFKCLDNVTNGRPSLVSKCTVGHGWQWARKGIATAFSMNSLTAKVDVMNQAVSILMKQLKQISENKAPIDITSLMIHYTIDFITLAMFGECFHTSQDYDKSSDGNGDNNNSNNNGKISEGKTFLNELTIATKEYMRKQTIDPLRKHYFLNQEVQRAKAATKYLRNFSYKLLKKYRDTHTLEQIEKDSSIMSNFIKTPYPSDDDRCADIIVFLLAGHDITGCALAWTILEVAKNPHVLHKIRLELDTINPDRSKLFDKNNINQCEYLWNVIRESMRLWPVPGVMRIAERDIEYKNYCIPKGSVLHISTFTIMRNNIQRPDDFIPERWQQGGVTDSTNKTNDKTNDKDKDNLKYGVNGEDLSILTDQFLPFSLGKRNCVGQNLALLELKLTLATIFQNYEFKVAGNDNDNTIKTFSSNDCRIGSVEYEFYLTIKPVNALLTVHERQ